VNLQRLFLALVVAVAGLVALAPSTRAAVSSEVNGSASIEAVTAASALPIHVDAGQYSTDMVRPVQAVSASTADWFPFGGCFSSFFCQRFSFNNCFSFFFGCRSSFTPFFFPFFNRFFNFSGANCLQFVGGFVFRVC
jgi:hypothetical protein